MFHPTITLIRLILQQKNLIEQLSFVKKRTFTGDVFVGIASANEPYTRAIENGRRI
jgi:hypothetical protein